ncbi:MAG: AAA family ATPase [Nitrososphaeria archaeon]|nr:AAA family ATPase [Conexivisphaerales archaeon]
MSKAIIKEVILENFMSYKYGRITLKPGFNFITGPNGAGKSAILLGMSLAMGQLSTERSRKLADLVRRGEDIGRVSLVINNSKENGKRPFPAYNKDEIMLSRYLRKDGSYWFEIDYKEASRQQVLDLLKKVGIDPNNLLIIMPQGMVDEFIMIKPEDKLKMVEEALGIANIRENLLDAKNRLKNIIAEENQYQDLIGKAMDSLEKWREEYDRLVMSRQLKQRLEELNAEYAWAEVLKLEKSINSTNEKINKINEEISTQTARNRELLSDFESDKNRYNTLVQIIKESAAKAYKGDEKSVTAIYDSLNEINSLLEKMLAEYSKVKVGEYRIDSLNSSLKELNRDLESLKNELNEAIKKVTGQRPANVRTISEIEDEIRTINAQLKVLGDVNQEAEKVYLEFKAKVDEYKEKLDEVRKNKEKTMKEIESRSEEWKEVIRKTISEINEKYNEIMARINASGKVILINENDPENAGLRLYASFVGTDLIPLDSFSQSGGELSAAVTAFLLAVQMYIVSPFRALDEFDVHMDPIIREKFIKAIYDVSQGSETQYLIITPNFPSFYAPDINFIIVQKSQNGSAPKVIAK